VYPSDSRRNKRLFLKPALREPKSGTRSVVP
jgi:hypothetical protein